MEIFSHKKNSWVSYGDVELSERSEVPKISSYLDGVINQIELIEYEIELELDLMCLFEFLDEDLPKSDDTEGRSALMDDMINLSEHFYKLTKSKCIKISIEPVSDGMCRLFHVDNITQRMICTYKGEGTEWLEEGNVIKEGLGSGDNNNIVRDFNLIKKANAFDVLLLKGRKHPTSRGGAVHRSPQISPMCQKRLLFKIDEF